MNCQIIAPISTIPTDLWAVQTFISVQQGDDIEMCNYKLLSCTSYRGYMGIEMCNYSNAQVGAGYLGIEILLYKLPEQLILYL